MNNLFITDPYGVSIFVGSKVAFNYSGEVRIGTVVDIKSVTHTDYLGVKRTCNPWGDNEPYVSISVREEKSGRISKVGKRKNLVVLG